MSKKDKSLIIYNQPHKGLKVHDKRDILEIGLSIDESNKKEYLMNRIKELETANQKLKDALNSLSGRRDEIKYLKEFREMFSGYCMKRNVKMTIIQCSNLIKKEDCSMKETCKTRLEILKRIEL